MDAELPLQRLARGRWMLPLSVEQRAEAPAEPGQLQLLGDTTRAKFPNCRKDPGLQRKQTGVWSMVARPLWIKNRGILSLHLARIKRQRLNVVPLLSRVADEQPGTARRC